jgi:hypothetical protein
MTEVQQPGDGYGLGLVECTTAMIACGKDGESFEDNLEVIQHADGDAW